MIRSYNYTGRRSLPRECVHIVLREGSNGVSEFDAQVDLSTYGLPNYAQVYIEAYYKSSVVVK